MRNIFTAFCSVFLILLAEANAAVWCSQWSGKEVALTFTDKVYQEFNAFREINNSSFPVPNLFGITPSRIPVTNNTYYNLDMVKSDNNSAQQLGYSMVLRNPITNRIVHSFPVSKNSVIIQDNGNIVFSLSPKRLVPNRMAVESIDIEFAFEKASFEDRSIARPTLLSFKAFKEEFAGYRFLTPTSSNLGTVFLKQVQGESDPTIGDVTASYYAAILTSALVMNSLIQSVSPEKIQEIHKVLIPHRLQVSQYFKNITLDQLEMIRANPMNLSSILNQEQIDLLIN